eukprot:6551559-Ditylum_brightwellii.AAC.1
MCTTIENIEEYIVGYFCKRVVPSSEWDTTLCSVVEQMIKHEKGDNNLYSVRASMMNTFTKSTSFTRDEAPYFLGSGVYKRVTKSVEKIFIGNIKLNDIVAENADRHIGTNDKPENDSS